MGFADFFNPIAAVGGGILDYVGGQATNAANAAEAQKNREFQASQADIAFGRQKEMASTGYQRTVADLKKAGLNPMLAYMNGPQGTSSAPQAGSVGNPQMENTLGKGVSTALAGLKTMQDVRNSQTDITLKEAQAVSTLAAAQQQTASARQTEQLIGLLKYQMPSKMAEADAAENKARLDKTWAGTERVLNNVLTGSQVVNNASSAVSNFLPTKALNKLIQEATKRGAAFERAYRP